MRKKKCVCNDFLSANHPEQLKDKYSPHKIHHLFVVHIHKGSLLLFFEVKSKLMSPTTDNHKQTDLINLIKRTLVFPFSFFFPIAL